MPNKIVNTANAPAPIGPYSQAVWAGNMLFVSGQIAMNPATGDLEMDNINAETDRVMQNIAAILTEAKLSFKNIVKTTIFLSDMNHFAAVNETYGSYFTKNFPARETVAVKTLPKNVNVEISVIAMRTF
jgi:2-iminobutanoate/2-iminopropanoate deaminase